MLPLESNPKAHFIAERHAALLGDPSRGRARRHPPWFEHNDLPIADQPRVECPSGLAAVTSLSSCLALPWAMPDLAGLALGQIDRFCEEANFGHLHFGLDGGFWQSLLEASKGLD